MPCLELSVPRLEHETKRKLTSRLTEAFVENSRFKADIFGIRYLEYEIDGAASAGKQWDGGTEKPYIHFVFYGPRLSRTEKSKLIAAFTQVYTECIAKPCWTPVIYICELPFDNIGVAGKPLSEKDYERIKNKFYYDLPNE